MMREVTAGQQAATLKRMANTFNMPVLVTNQVPHFQTLMVMPAKPLLEQVMHWLSTLFHACCALLDQVTAGNTKKDTEVAAALGLAWAHAINTRLVLEGHANHRCLRASPDFSLLHI